MDRLTIGEATVSELSSPFEISGPAVSRHLRVLETSGLILQQRHGSWRTNVLQPQPLAEVTAYLEKYRGFLDASFERLRDHLRVIQENESGES